jgi:type IV pilus assembly protein PilY1
VSGNNITVTTDTVSASTANGQGFGYIISSTTRDGAHFHSGILGFDFTDATGVTGCANCEVPDLPTSWTYTTSDLSAGLLEDPLWYTAKYGGFIDSNVNNKPDLTSEWDSVNNTTGLPGADTKPDNFFYASNPLQLENALNRVFLDILKRASSGTAAAVVANNVSGEGAMYQAYYEPSRQDTTDSVSWIGTVQALWLDSYGYIR